MINCIAYDVEVLRNFFSITFVSINSYLKVLKIVLMLMEKLFL